MNAAIARVQPFVLIVMCVGILLAYLVGMYVTGPIHSASRWMGAMLACTSVVVVLQRPGYKDSLSYGWTRVLGTFIGALVAYLYLAVFPFTVVGMLMAVFVLEMLFMLLNIYNNGHIATVTLLIIMLVSQMNPKVDPAMNCFLRFFESAVGVSVGIGILWATEQWNKLRTKLLHMGANKDGKPLDMATMPLRWGHLRVLIVASFGQMTGGALATLIGIVVPMLQIIGHPELSTFAQGGIACTSLVGIMVGSLIFGGLSDRKGYLFFFRFCPALILAASLFAVWSDSIHGLVISLFCMGLGIGGGYSLDSDYISEIMPDRWKLTMVGIAKSFSALGNIVVAVSCLSLLRRWQSPEMWNGLFLLISLLAIVMLLTRVRFFQSPSWLLAHGQRTEAEHAIRYFLGPDVMISDSKATEKSAAAKSSWLDMFRNGNGKKVVFSGIPWACEGVGVYGIGVFLPMLVMALGIESSSDSGFAHIVDSVEKTVYINLFVLLGFALGLRYMNRFSHVRMQTWGFILCAAGLALLLMAYELHWNVWAAIAGFMIFELFLNAGPHLITFILPAQIYPVEDRGAGAGIAAALGKLGGIIGVLFMPVLLKAGGLTLTMSVTIGILLVGALVTAVLGHKVGGVS